MLFNVQPKNRLPTSSVQTWNPVSRQVVLVVPILVCIFLGACSITRTGQLPFPALDGTERATAAGVTGTPSEPLTATATVAFLPLVTAGPVDIPGDLSGLEIYMEKTGCEGPCPVYSLAVQEDGNVIYNGRTCVNVVGEQTGQIPQEGVRSLVEAFYQTDFFSLQDAYVEDVEDIPATLIRFTLQGRTKQVVSQVYDPNQAPAALVRLEEAIYDTTNAQQWVTADRTPAPCP